MYIYIHTINITEGSLKMRLDFTHFFFTDHYTCKNPDQSFRFASLIFNLFAQLCFWGFFFSFVIIKKKVNRINLSKLREISQSTVRSQYSEYRYIIYIYRKINVTCHNVHSIYIYTDDTLPKSNGDENQSTIQTTTLPHISVNHKM